MMKLKPWHIGAGALVAGGAAYLIWGRKPTKADEVATQPKPPRANNGRPATQGPSRPKPSTKVSASSNAGGGPDPEGSAYFDSPAGIEFTDANDAFIDLIGKTFSLLNATFDDYPSLFGKEWGGDSSGHGIAAVYGLSQEAADGLLGDWLDYSEHLQEMMAKLSSDSDSNYNNFTLEFEELDWFSEYFAAVFSDISTSKGEGSGDPIMIGSKPQRENPEAVASISEALNMLEEELTDSGYL